MGSKLRATMDQGNQLFTLALGLVPPWMVDEVRFTAEEKRLDLHVNHWDGVLSWFESRDTRGILGGFQQPPPIRQGQSPWLSHPQELHQHGLPDPG